jgi:hypothetical protein
VRLRRRAPPTVAGGGFVVFSAEFVFAFFTGATGLEFVFVFFRGARGLEFVEGLFPEAVLEFLKDVFVEF